MAVYTVICIFVIFRATTGKLFTPDNFYRIDPGRSYVLDGTVYQGKLNISSPFRVMGRLMDHYEETKKNNIWINKNGIIKFDSTTNIIPTQSGYNRAVVAPLRSWLSFGNGTGAVFYRQTTNRRIRNQAVKDVQCNFCGVEAFHPTTVIIVTWYNMVIDPCTTTHNNTDKYCQCVNVLSPDVCQCVDYPLVDYCECYDKNYNHLIFLEKCECHEYFSTELFFNHNYINEYCLCLGSHSKVYCDCWAEYGFYYRDEPYCRCMASYYTNIGNNSEIYCRCLYFEFNRYIYCKCRQDYYNRYGTTDYSDALCHCIYQYEDYGRPIYVCLRELSYISEGYRHCIEQFSSYFQSYFDMHEYCLCYSENLANGTVCICNDTCMFKRALQSPSVTEGIHLQDRDAIVPVPGDGSVDKWSRSYNTFQAVIIADSNTTYVMFNYASIGIPKYLGDGVRPALVGVLKRWFWGFTHEFSNSNRLNKLKDRSNVGIRGRWMYRVDGYPVQEPYQC